METRSIAINIGNLEDALRLAHGGLDVEGLDVLPVLLEEGDEEVDGNLDVSVNLVLGHLNVGHSDTEGKDLLELELDGTTDGVDLLVGVIQPLGQILAAPAYITQGALFVQCLVF